MSNCFFWHLWGLWDKPYRYTGMLKTVRTGVKTEFSELRQQRTCKRCGETQDRLVRDG